MVYDVLSVLGIGEVARSAYSCGNFCLATQDIVTTVTVWFPDAGKTMFHLPYSAPPRKQVHYLTGILTNFAHSHMFCNACRDLRAHMTQQKLAGL
jgi:hypothetical protein